MKLLTLIIFLFAYAFFAFSKKNKGLVAWLAVSLLLFFGVVPLKEAFWAVNWNVIGLFAGTLIVAELFIFSRVPEFLADWIIARSKSVGLALLAICVFTSIISIFVENVATVLIVAPIAFALTDRLKISPVTTLIAIAISSNLQGTATLIGDPPSMILGAFAQLDFLDFFFLQGKPSIFFAVQLGAIASFLVLYLFFRSLKQQIDFNKKVEIISWVPSLILILMVVGLAGLGFLPFYLDYAAGLISLLCAIIGLVWFAWQQKTPKPSWDILRRFDYETLSFLLAIFVLVFALDRVGLIADLALVLKNLVGSNVFIAYSLIVWLSVFFSAFIDNVPYIIAMLPVTTLLSSSLGISPYLLNFGLLIGSCVGGNITPVGAAANIVACGLLRKKGYQVSFGQFIKVGLPFTLAAVLVSYVFLWLVWR